MKNLNTPKDSDVWAVGNTFGQDLKQMAVVAAFGLVMIAIVAWLNDMSLAKLISLILGS